MKTNSFFKNCNHFSLFAFFSLVFLFGCNSNSDNKIENNSENIAEVSSESDDNIYTDVKAIYVLGGDVYAAGSMCRGTSETDVPTLWKNGVAQKIGSEGNFNSATSIFVSGEDIYVTITESYKTVLWKNGERQQLGDFSANYVFVDGNDVYLAGSINDSVAIWKNGNVENLGKKGSANSIIVRDGDIYVLGNDKQLTQLEINGSSMSVDMDYPCLWKNGEMTRLSYRPGSAEDLFISPKGDILVVGALEQKAFLWKNGELKNLENAEMTSSHAYSITQTSDGRVFVGGCAFDEHGTLTPVAWVDGRIYVLLKNMFSETYAVFSNDNTVYFGGEGSRGSQWAVWKYEGKTEFSPNSLIRLNNNDVK